MGKPLSKLGGWLKLFYVTLWIGMVLLAYMLLLLPGLFSRPVDAFYSFVSLIDYGLRGFLGYKIIKVTKKKEAVTPDRILRLLTYILLVGCLFAAPRIYFARLVYGMPGVRGIVISVIEIIVWVFICATYFKKSKRVLAHYGKNADNFF
jgi:hypothetical protein